MIISIDTGKVKEHLPYKRDYQKWKRHISDSDLNHIKDELNRMIDSNEVHTAGWMPGSNWRGTIFEPIYHACGKNQTQAALLLYGKTG